MKVVIIGGVAVGATAAARIRRLDEKAEIILLERSEFISYANCGLPYYIGDTITDRDDLTLQTPTSFYARFRVDVRVRHEVLAIDTARKYVTVKDLNSGITFQESYDKLVLSPGAKPVRPDVKGADHDEIFTLRTVEDAIRIKEHIQKTRPKTAVVVGGGFIGLETAENLTKQGLDVTIIQRPKQLMNIFDEDIASFIHASARQKGLKLALGEYVEGFVKTSDGFDVLLKDKNPIRANLVILAVGVEPDAKLAKDAGIQIGVKGGIVVNDRLQTSDPDVYAGGDAVVVKRFVDGRDALIPLAGPANKHGRIIADNICGFDAKYDGSQGTAIIKFFDIAAATTGLNEKTAKAEGIDCDAVILSPLNHAGYYPGARVMTMKVIFEKESYRLLGAQIVGYDGVDKRIDVLSVAIRARMNATTLKELDLAYAPPYSAAKDPVNIAGYMIENIAKGVVKQWRIGQLDEILDNDDVQRVDARTRAEYARDHIEGFVNIPVDELRQRVGELDMDKPVYLICQSGLRSYVATRILEGLGFDAYNFAGGFRFYEAVMKERALVKEAYPCGLDKPIQ